MFYLSFKVCSSRAHGFLLIRRVEIQKSGSFGNHRLLPFQNSRESSQRKRHFITFHFGYDENFLKKFMKIDLPKQEKYLLCNLLLFDSGILLNSKTAGWHSCNLSSFEDVKIDLNFWRMLSPGNLILNMLHPVIDNSVIFSEKYFIKHDLILS